MPRKDIFEELQGLLRGRSAIWVEATFLERRLELRFDMGVFIPEIRADRSVIHPNVNIKMGPLEGDFTSEAFCLLDDDLNLKAAGFIYRDNGEFSYCMSMDAPPEKWEELGITGGSEDLADMEDTIITRIGMIKLSKNIRNITPPDSKNSIPFPDLEP